jgi:hypothetical protein
MKIGIGRRGTLRTPEAAGEMEPRRTGWVRIRVMGSGSVRKAMKVRGSWQVGQIRGNTFS